MIAGIVLIFAIVIVAMPFLVWGMHSRIKDAGSRLMQVEADLQEISMVLDSLEIMVHDIARDSLSEESVTALSKINRLRLKTLNNKSARKWGPGPEPPNSQTDPGKP